ncbi:FAD-dependent monooxygenase [Candidatus Protochlamydia phocaeensis]|uniref:FAD-dependent monooxygenase n=1 Tax=Candidatus Protochlamydia phocaeensis TaxID=1414722 RepID=UPI00083962D0|nr:FAD-dependent monooxygenase [Candidatus Protochlamydia phocaeensis]
MNKNSSVLIVGAGPSGLMMACELARRGISFRLIDRKPEGIKTTNAVGIQTRTLELFDQVELIDRFLEIGIKCRSACLHSEGEVLNKISFDHLDSFYKFIFLLPQYETERILRERLQELQGHIERQVELMDFKQLDQQVQTTLKHADGQIETLTVDWLVGCDGIRSLVREKSDIPFIGQDIPQTYLVADVKIESRLPNEEMQAYFSSQKIFAAFPLGDGLYRIVANLGAKDTRKTIPEEEIRAIIEERSNHQLQAKEVLWSAPFWIHSMIAKTMHKGRVFIAGDAAHVHSPAGGQGMNTGFQDAYNLAWKLALVIHGQAKPSLLDSYQDERHPVIEEIVRMTEGITKAAIVKNIFLFKLRNFLARTLLRKRFIIDKIAMKMAQLSIRYKKSPFIHYQTNIPSKAPHPGERAPDVVIGSSSKRLYDYLRNLQHNLLIFTGRNPSGDELKEIELLQHWIEQEYSSLIKCFVVSPSSSLLGLQNVILDEQSSIHQRYQANGPGLCLIRPDQYIAFFKRGFPKEELGRFFDQYFIKMTEVNQA